MITQEVLDAINKQFAIQLEQKETLNKATVLSADPTGDWEQFELRTPLQLQPGIDHAGLDASTVNAILLAHDYDLWVGAMLEKEPHWEHHRVRVEREPECKNGIKWVSYDRFSK